MKAISIRQPHVEHVLLGHKKAEYRSRPCRIRGVVLLHASKSREEDGHEGLPLGCLVGVVEVFGCSQEGISDYSWHLRNPLRFARPIPFRGAVGWFPVPDEMVKEVELIVPGTKFVTVSVCLANVAAALSG